MSVLGGLFNGIKIYWRGIIIILWPLICLNIFFLGWEPKWRCAYVIMIMALFWVTEVIPLGVTSMIPMFAWPALDILPTGETTKEYFSPTNIMFFAGLVVAMSLEYSRLHLRIAYAAILTIGTTHKRLSFAFAMIVTFISLWVNNTAATAMMAPIIKAILIELQSQGLVRFFEDGLDPDDETIETERKGTRTTSFYFLLTCMSASLGGIGTIIGTGTNLAGVGLLETRFPNMPPLSFGVWSAMGLPFAFITAVFTWAWFNFLFMGLGRNKGMDPEILESKINKRQKEENTLIKAVVKKKQEENGPMTVHQVLVSILFGLVILLWVFRDPGFVTGWNIITPKKIGDASAGIFVIFIMFLLPTTCVFWKSYHSDPTKRPDPESATQGVMIWRYIHMHMAWEMLFLLGGGFAIAKGAKECGLTEALGESLRILEGLPRLLIVASVSLFATLITELTSNVAICNLILPIVLEMSVVLTIHPLYLAVPVIWCCSFAFLMPVGTPANLVAKGISHFPLKYMLMGGIGVKLVTYVLTIVFIETLGQVIWDFSEFPEWAT